MSAQYDDRIDPRLIRIHQERTDRMASLRAQLAVEADKLIGQMEAAAEALIAACDEMQAAGDAIPAGQRYNAARLAELVRNRLDTARAIKGRAQ